MPREPERGTVTVDASILLAVAERGRENDVRRMVAGRLVLVPVPAVGDFLALGGGSQRLLQLNGVLEQLHAVQGDEESVTHVENLRSRAQDRGAPLRLGDATILSAAIRYDKGTVLLTRDRRFYEAVRADGTLGAELLRDGRV